VPKKLFLLESAQNGTITRVLSLYYLNIIFQKAAIAFISEQENRR
jgi:hypothetical protein